MTFDKKEKKALFEKKREGFLKEKKDVVPVATNNESFGEEVAAEVMSMGDEFVRVRMPRNNEVLGILEARLGGSRCRVKCLDAKTRVCRIPGRLKRKLWVREGDVVLIEPWEFEGDEKGDIIHKYYPNQVTVLKKKGLLKNLEQMNEF